MEMKETAEVRIEKRKNILTFWNFLFFFIQNQKQIL